MSSQYKANAFTILQQKNISLCAIDECPSMDLLAGLTEDGTLVVFRTLSWDKILQKPGVEILGSIATALRFAPHGKLIALGAADGGVAIFDLEKGAYLLALPFSHNCPSVASPVTQLSWGSAPLLCRDEPTHSSMWSEAWRHGGLDAVARAGVAEYTDADGDDMDTSVLTLEEIYQSLHGFVLFSVAQSHRVRVYAFGVCPLFSVALGDDNNTDSPWILPEWMLGGSDVSLYKKIDNASSFAEQLRHLSLDNRLFRHYYWQEHVSKVLFSINTDMDRIQDLSSQCARKWKDATKLLPIKLGLLQTALEGYELPYNPVSFFYTVAMCGAWHPVAQTTFSSHWNDQGISRLRVAIDFAAKFISQTVNLRLVPIATNLQLRCRELEGLLAVASSEELFELDCLRKHVENVSTVRRSSELLLYKLDDMSAEVDRAHRGLLLFLQFIKEYHVACAATPSAAAVSPDVHTMKSYMALFDPRLVRAPATQSLVSKSPSAATNEETTLMASAPAICPHALPLRSAEAEAVSGTHLYAYLQEGGTVPQLQGSRQMESDRCGASVVEASTVRAENTEKEIFKNQLSDILKKLENSSVRCSLESDSGFGSRSLLSQLKLTKIQISGLASIVPSVVEGVCTATLISAAGAIGGGEVLVAFDSISLRQLTLLKDFSISSGTGLSHANQVSLSDVKLSAHCTTLPELSASSVLVMCETVPATGGQPTWLASRIALPPHIGKVTAMKFYHKLMTPISDAASTQSSIVNDLHVVVCSSPSAQAQQCHIVKINLRNIPFRPVPTSPNEFPTNSAITSVWPSGTSAVTPSDEMMDTRGDEDDVLFTVKVKELPQAIANVGSLHLSGQRGLACVSSYCSKGDSGTVVVLDMEEDEEFSDDEDESEADDSSV